MKTKSDIDNNKFYEVTVTNVKPHYRINYNSQGLQIYFYIKELNQKTCRTFTIPKTLKPTDILSKFITTINPNLNSLIVTNNLLEKPSNLSKLVLAISEGQSYGAKLSINKTGEYIDILELNKLEEV